MVRKGGRVGQGFLIALSCGSGYRVQVLLGTKLGHTQQPRAITSEITNGLGPFCCDRKEAPSPVAHMKPSHVLAFWPVPTVNACLR